MGKHSTSGSIAFVRTVIDPTAIEIMKRYSHNPKFKDFIEDKFYLMEYYILKSEKHIAQREYYELEKISQKILELAFTTGYSNLVAGSLHLTTASRQHNYDYAFDKIQEIRSCYYSLKPMLDDVLALV